MLEKFTFCLRSLKINCWHQQIYQGSSSYIFIFFLKMLSNSNKTSHFTSASFFSSTHLPTKPKCPNNNIVKNTCVTQTCKFSPLICDNNNECNCHNAHKFCKIMQWDSLVCMLNNYKQQQTQELREYIKKIESIYHSISKKIKQEVEYFHQKVESKLYGQEFQNIRYYLSCEEYDKIKSSDLGKVVTKMTKNREQESESSSDYNVKEFTLNEMKNIEKMINHVFTEIESLYDRKFIMKGHTKYQKGSRMSKSSNNLNVSKVSQMKSSMCNEVNPQILNEELIKKMSQSLLIQQKNTPFYQTVASNLKLFSTHSTNFKTPHKSDNRKSQRKVQEKNAVIFQYPKYIPSKILSEASVLNVLLNVGRIKEYKLLFRASQNQFSVQQFYRKMHIRQNTQPYPRNMLTVILFKTQHHKIIAGSTKLKWLEHTCSKNDDSEQENDQPSKYQEDIRGSTYLYSIDLNERYQLKDPKHAIYCGKNSIGFGKQDMRIYSGSHKNNRNFSKFPCSFNNGLYLPIKKSSMDLSGSHSSYNFKISEWEVFEVVSVNEKASDRTLSKKKSKDTK